MGGNDGDIVKAEITRIILSRMMAIFRWTHEKLSGNSVDGHVVEKWKFEWIFDGKFECIFCWQLNGSSVIDIVKTSLQCLFVCLWYCDDRMWMSTWRTVYVHIMLLSSSKDWVPIIRDYYHDQLAVMGSSILHTIWSRGHNVHVGCIRSTNQFITSFHVSSQIQILRWFIIAITP